MSKQHARIRTPLPSGPRRKMSVNKREGKHKVIDISTLQMQGRAQALEHEERPTAAAAVHNICCAPCSAISDNRQELNIHQPSYGMPHDGQPLPEHLKIITVAGKGYRASNPAPSAIAPPQRVPKPANTDPTLGQKRDAPVCGYNCVFDFAGCERTFARKNEWKRHVAIQHLLLNYWRCPRGACATAEPAPIFNRKDLFTQHLKRMHAPKEIKDLLNNTNTNTTNSSKKPSSHKPELIAAAEALAKWNTHVQILQSTAIQQRCTLPDSMRCPAPECAATEFSGAGGWDQRMEHIARHMVPPSEGGSSARASEKVVFGGKSDETLVNWASRPDVAIIKSTKEGVWVLRSPLERILDGSVVVTAHVPDTLANVQSNEIPAVERDTPYATGNGSEEVMVPRLLKRKAPFTAADTTGAASKKTKIKFINSQSRNAGKPSVVAAEEGKGRDEDVAPLLGLECNGYTSTDSASGDRLQPNEWRLHQVKTRTFATNPSVTQYWHWVTEEKDGNVIEHQVLESVWPIKWSVFKKPYNFHLKPADIQEVSFARGSMRVIITHKKGRDGKDMNPRMDLPLIFPCP